MWADYTDAVAECANVPPDDAAARIETTIAAVEATGYLLEAARMRVAASVVLATRPSGRAAAAGLARAAHGAVYRAGLACLVPASGGDACAARCSSRYAAHRHRWLAVGVVGASWTCSALPAEGLDDRGICERLVISESTAIRHVANIYGKLGANNRAAAVRIATERGLMAGRADMASSARRRRRRYIVGRRERNGKDC